MISPKSDSKNDEKWLLCVDPDSQQVYTLNTHTNAVVIESPTQEYRIQANKALEEIDQILKLKKGNWLMNSTEVDQYRRRKVPSYLLHKQSSSIPTYICQSTLSNAFKDYHNIKLQVLLNEYADVLFKEGVISEQQLSKDNPNTLEIDAGLVTGVDEVIKSVLREIYLLFNGIQLRTKSPDNQFIFQISGLNEYLTGNHPMLSYDRVRISLRGMKHLEVILTEKPKQQQSLFPAMITRKSDQKVYPPINWTEFERVPILLWYSPKKLPKYDKRIDLKRYSTDVQTRHQSNISASVTINRNAAYSSQSQDPDVMNLLIQRDHQASLDPTDIKFQLLKQQIIEQQNAKQQEQINDIISIANMLEQKDLTKVKKKLLYSGECDWPFSVRVSTLENVLKSFEQDDKDLGNDRATYNGLIPPIYITKSEMKYVPEHGHKDNNTEEIQEKQIHLKLHQRTGRVINVESIQELHKTARWIPYGGVEHLDEQETMQRLNGLDFLPYLISIQVTLQHGSKLLTSWCTAETKKQPFSNCPKFYETLTFPGIKLSQLPQESRLCFNIIAHSASGLQQILGSATMYIFDQEKLFRQSANSLNVWPFYKIDPRLLCMEEYWGLHSALNTSNNIDSQTLDYTRLIIQLDQFTEEMRWSLRDEKQMEELGFPKSARCQRYYEMRKVEQEKNPEVEIKQIDSFGSYYSASSSLPQLTAQQQQIQNQQQKRNTVMQNPLYNQRLNTGEGNQYIGSEVGQSIQFDNTDRSPFAQSALQIQNGNSSLNMDTGTFVTSSLKNSLTFSEKLNQATSSGGDTSGSLQANKNWSTTPRTEDLAILQALLKYNPLNRASFSEQHKFILMICRNHYKTLPYALQILLMAIEWDDPEQVREAHNMIKLWTPLAPEDALPLLDAPFADETVRLYAVERSSILSDDELQLYMLELTQCLMFEKHLFNPLAEMLLERALQNPWVVGHELFWLLRAQLHVKPAYQRYVLLLEQLLMLCGSFRTNLLNEVTVEEELNRVAEAIKDPSIPKDRRNKVLQDKLQKLEFTKHLKSFSFALDARMEAYEFSIPHCKVMDSKKMPLWLALKPKCVDDSCLKNMPKRSGDSPDRKHMNHSNIQNQVSIQLDIDLDLEVPIKAAEEIKPQAPPVSNNNIYIIFKNGDDIRQDMLTLQLIKIMDKIWLDAGRDFRMKPYKTVTTQDNVGMIEVVTNSLTIEKLHTDGGITGAFQEKTIWTHLRKKNKDPQSFEIATDNFLRSCAGYCVATFVLGIGDRHTGNIMVSDTGHLFHIDFGHFLGNFKSKFGIKRERTKFVLTQEMAFVMGGRDGELFKRFQADCAWAYNMVRKHGHFLINIFLMNLSAGMPELQHAHHVRYLEEQLALNISDSEATAKFRQEIISSLNDTWRQIDNWFHYCKRK